jgi:hypothetical protein
VIRHEVPGTWTEITSGYMQVEFDAFLLEEILMLFLMQKAYEKCGGGLGNSLNWTSRVGCYLYPSLKLPIKMIFFLAGQESFGFEG